MVMHTVDHGSRTSAEAGLHGLGVALLGLEWRFLWSTCASGGWDIRMINGHGLNAGVLRTYTCTFRHSWRLGPPKRT